eukprot:395967-Prorocentrum_minimum.AAC.1
MANHLLTTAAAKKRAYVSSPKEQPKSQAYGIQAYQTRACCSPKDHRARLCTRRRLLERYRQYVRSVVDDEKENLIGLDTDIKPFLSHPTNGGFYSPPKHLRSPKKC